MTVTRYNARDHLKTNGWTVLAAAKVLKVHRVHLSYVLHGKRQSQRLLTAIAELPKAPSTPQSNP